MVAKITGISRDLVIHPGETIADLLEERGITQAELAIRTGVTPAYVSNVIAGKKDISANFALALEYALDISKTFWLNLQANYDAELMEINKISTISEKERIVREELAEVVKYLRRQGIMPIGERKDASILSLRKALGISDISRLCELVPGGGTEVSLRNQTNLYVLGAWISLCRLEQNNGMEDVRYDLSNIDNLIAEIKGLMIASEVDIQSNLRKIMWQYGIDFSIIQSFRNAPVQGYLSQRDNGTCQMVLAIQDSQADIFWLSLFHELGHLVNGDIGKSSKFIDDSTNEEKERKADVFANNNLINSSDYSLFIDNNNFTIECINQFAASQNIMPYVVISRLQREKRLRQGEYSSHIPKFSLNGITTDMK